MSAFEARQPESAIALGDGAWISRNALHFSFSRSSGPGGQAVNKLSTRAQLRVRLSDVHGLDDAARSRLRHLAGRRLTRDDELLIEAETFRSQLDNKNACLERLEGLVRAALIRPRVRKKKRPTRAMIQKRLDSKRRQSEKKEIRRSRRRFRDSD